MTVKATAGGYPEVWVVVPQVSTLKSVAFAFGVDGNDLEKTRKVPGIPLSWTFHIKTSLPRFGPIDQPVLGLFIDDAQVQSIEELGPPILCVVPWLQTDVKKWVASFLPVDIATGQPSAGPAPITDAATLEGLKVIAFRGGVSHPLDREAAVTALKALKKAGKLPDPDALRGWAVGENMSFKDAGKLADWATKLHAGRTVRAK
jgi:hypothetical protein